MTELASIVFLPKTLLRILRHNEKLGPMFSHVNDVQYCRMMQSIFENLACSAKIDGICKFHEKVHLTRDIAQEWENCFLTALKELHLPTEILQHVHTIIEKMLHKKECTEITNKISHMIIECKDNDLKKELEDLCEICSSSNQKL